MTLRSSGTASNDLAAWLAKSDQALEAARMEVALLKEQVARTDEKSGTRKNRF